MRILKIRWQRLVSDGKTCPRCESTGKALEEAVFILKQVLNPMGIEVRVEKDELSGDEFQKDSLSYNQIFINDSPLENWIGGRVGQSPCCDVCGSSECRTIEIGGETFEAIPAYLIVKAGLNAALQMMDVETNRSCCSTMNLKTSGKHCC